MTRVLPDPAPARTRQGPPRWWTASSWAGLRDGGGEDTEGAGGTAKGRAIIAKDRIDLAPGLVENWRAGTTTKVRPELRAKGPRYSFICIETPSITCLCQYGLNGLRQSRNMSCVSRTSRSVCVCGWASAL